MQFTVALRMLTKRVLSRPAGTTLSWSSTRPLSNSNDFFCLGWDGRPLLNSLNKGETGRQRLDEEESNSEAGDYRKYHEKQKSSPQLKVEIVAARKPIIQRANHGGDEKEILLVRETVDDALLRAEEMWRAAKVRGDPDSPQARALARILREKIL
ncbi:uncharacterized protein LOC110021923 [Phalaenopsis equestris]|uniref:uncharacterized protein LOC110021923 n=1 Tax=Phalaenopsis equestris TaxID=78828 RepID=UPI0009E26D57|nr:uncharacterized protein LOC110021923 [Phalaenopsis equestris]